VNDNYWNSTIYVAWIAVGAALAVALLVIATWWLRR